MEPIKRFFNQAIEYLSSAMSQVGGFFGELFSGEKTRQQPELDVGYIMDRNLQIVQENNSLSPFEQKMVNKLQAYSKANPEEYAQMMAEMNQDAQQALAHIKETKQINIGDATNIDPKIIAMMDLADGKADGSLHINEALRKMDFNGDNKISKADGQHADAKAFARTMNALLPAINGSQITNQQNTKDLDITINEKDIGQIEAVMDAIGSEVDIHTDKNGKLDHIDISNLPAQGPSINLTPSPQPSNNAKSVFGR